MADSDRINEQSLDEKTHGAHGKRSVETPEQKVDAATPLPGNSGHKGDDHFSNAAWGSAASGGSVIDKRPPENK